MLGRLAKYLRFLGYDTYYPNGDMSDNELLRIAREEERVLLTRDKELAMRGGVLIESDDYREQFRFVVERFNLKTDNALTRCSVCNTVLVKVDRSYVKDSVPPHVYDTHDEFYQCPQCGRVYWWGSHTEKIIMFLKEP